MTSDSSASRWGCFDSVARSCSGWSVSYSEVGGATCLGHLMKNRLRVSGEMAIPCENPLEPDSSRVTSNAECMRRWALDPIGAFRSARREVPPKSSSGPSQYSGDLTAAHVREEGFWTPRLGRTQPGTLRLIADDLPDHPSNGSAVSSRHDLRDA